MADEFFRAFPNTVVPGYRVLGFSALPGYRALKAGDGAWSVHKTLFGFRAPLIQLYINKILIFTVKSPPKRSKLLREYFFVVFSNPA